MHTSAQKPALTPRQVEIIGSIARSRTSRAVAAILGIAKRTAEARIASATVKLGASNRSHAAALAMTGQIISL